MTALLWPFACAVLFMASLFFMASGRWSLGRGRRVGQPGDVEQVPGPSSGPYRKLADHSVSELVPEERPARIRPGPRDACPFCGSTNLRKCSRCYGVWTLGAVETEPGPCRSDACFFHRQQLERVVQITVKMREGKIEQSCKVCGGAWTCEPKLES